MDGVRIVSEARALQLAARKERSYAKALRAALRAQRLLIRGVVRRCETMRAELLTRDTLRKAKSSARAATSPPPSPDIQRWLHMNAPAGEADPALPPPALPGPP